ncbi:MAG TPA: hypothetical protein VMB81_13560 [Candidatus Sulfotelmatobacter sp.]|nr:hypothetical protein [Candidatus Sulfotelmatobacter sp.]
MREALQQGYHQFVKVTGACLVVTGIVLLGISLVLQLGYSPFQHPGAAPVPGGEADVLRLDSVRWLLTAIAGTLSGMRRAPRRSTRYEPGPGAAVAFPLTVLVGVVLMAAISTACWFYWMRHLPGGDRMQNVLLCGAYAVLPAALLFTFLAALLSRPAA